jgi:hypothetical protein
VSPHGLVAHDDSLYAAFSIAGFNGASGDVDITPYVPDTLVRPATSSFVLARVVSP